MCLIVVAWQVDATFPLVLAANRDESFDRPTRAAAFWEDTPGILAGRDERAGGTWLGISRGGRFAAVTNLRGAPPVADGGPSRGSLVSGFLRGEQAPHPYLEQVAAQSRLFAGFNLLAGDPDSLCCLNSREGCVRRLDTGIHGISNGDLDAAWPKVRKSVREMRRLLTGTGTAHLEAGRVPAIVGGLFTLLSDGEVPADSELPDTGVGLEMERRLGPIRVSAGGYGTRSSTVVLRDAAGVLSLEERTLDRDGVPAEVAGGCIEP